jgi:hypothetical protein
MTFKSRNISKEPMKVLNANLVSFSVVVFSYCLLYQYILSDMLPYLGGRIQDIGIFPLLNFHIPGGQREENQLQIYFQSWAGKWWRIPPGGNSEVCNQAPLIRV